MEKQEVLHGSFSLFIFMNSFSTTDKSNPLTFNEHEQMEKSAVLSVARLLYIMLLFPH